MKRLCSFICVLSLFVANVAVADRIAIIGGGASGLVSAWLLEKNHDVTLYEAEDRLGGHANSIEIKVDGKPVIIEAGAEYFNEKFYPRFMKLLNHYQLRLKSYTLVTTFYRTDSSDKIILPPFHDGTVEWISLSPANVFRSMQLQTVIDQGRKLIARRDTDTTLQTFADGLVITKDFKVNMFYPLLAGAWGVSPNDVVDFSAYNAIKYFIEGYDVTHYQWFEVEGGLKKYIEAVHQDLSKAQIKLNARVKQISKNNAGYSIVTENGETQEYDQIIFATNSYAASELLATMPETSDLSALLARIKYFDTKIAIHGDARFMPPSKSDWRVINVRYDGAHAAMTMYKDWKSSSPIFKTWLTYDVRSPNDKEGLLPANIYAMVNYKHPVPDKNYYDVQKEIKRLQGQQHIWFAGVWAFDNDSHESAIASAEEVAKAIEPTAERLKVLQ